MFFPIRFDSCISPDGLETWVTVSQRCSQRIAWLFWAVQFFLLANKNISLSWKNRSIYTPPIKSIYFKKGLANPSNSSSGVWKTTWFLPTLLRHRHIFSHFRPSPPALWPAEATLWPSSHASPGDPPWSHRNTILGSSEGSAQKHMEWAHQK